MNKENIKEILYIIIAVLMGIITIKFIIWLLPVILIAICSYYIYKSIKKNRNNTIKPKTKKKDIKIIDMVDEEN